MGKRGENGYWLMINGYWLLVIGYWGPPLQQETIMFKHILVPLDGSELAEQALAAATALTRQFHSQMTLLRVVQSPFLLSQTHNPSFAELIISLRQTEQKEAITYLQRLQERLKEQGISARYVLVEEETVAEAILTQVEQLHADTIVMGTHGHGGLRRWVYGSIADRVLRHADVPVLLVRGREDDPSQPILVDIPPIETFSDIHAPADIRATHKNDPPAHT